jgi:hypothetical protein
MKAPIILTLITCIKWALMGELDATDVASRFLGCRLLPKLFNWQNLANWGGVNLAAKAAGLGGGRCASSIVYWGAAAARLKRGEKMRFEESCEVVVLAKPWTERERGGGGWWQWGGGGGSGDREKKKNVNGSRVTPQVRAS